MDVSIIIVNWNTRDLLRDCLKSVYEQTKGISFEVIVIDNASSDGSVEMVKSEFYQVVLIENKQNRGFAAGVNQGIAVAKGRYALVLNSDTIVCDNAIEETMRYADKHPEAAMVGCQVLDNSNTIQMTCFRFPSVLNLFLHTFALNKIFKKNHFFGREWMLWWPRDSEREVEVVSGSFMLVRRNAIDDVGLMDEGYFLYYEETDWCYRFTKAGWKILFWPGAKIIHCHGGRNSSKQEALKMAVQMQKSCLIFFKKHRDIVSYITVRLLLMISLACRFCFWTVALFVKYLLRNSSNHEKKKIAENWSVLKYCAFGYEPLKDNKQTTILQILKPLKKITELIFALIYAVFLSVIRKDTSRVVLYYHGVSKADTGCFKKQMEYLARRCTVVKASEIMATDVGGAKNVVAITFDDAFVSVMENAVPILREYGLLGDIFVPVGNLSQIPHWEMPENYPDKKNETVMSKEQIEQLDKEGFEIFSHTLSHPVLTEIQDSRLDVELIESKQALEGIVGHEVIGISYPLGSYDTRVRKAAEKAGYKLGFTIEPGIVDRATGCLEIGRVSVSPKDSLIKFKLKASGAYHVVTYLRTLKRTLVPA